MPVIQIVIFAILGLVAVGTAVGMLLSRNAVYAALFLVLNFATIAILYLILGAPFIALAQITVYAGAIMVLFLFVIMLLGVEKLPFKERLRGQRLIAILLGVVFLGEAVLYLVYRGQAGQLPLPDAIQFVSPAELGRVLFSQYMLPFEITSIILLAALVGAIVLTHHDKPTPAAEQI
ncbi:MAG TPA: NADH-quinone oxidoreductase subunit J [Anaerolineaceae bacterium]|jgi:NADH-quinone oxidoreductase subunit J|nr:NADH-quinone oxidoreductase subunit J [Anaerolineaceae bacterium]HQH86140.1 NADH-quinone oxidoreductase subunit J [Anaerolineaceae bacterium]HQN44148.1 NADH-quinone oxidoreductase subunit J [Anaerolineaceae bacterium]